MAASGQQLNIRTNVRIIEVWITQPKLPLTPRCNASKP
jgi:hypothetical protein